MTEALAAALYAVVLASAFAAAQVRPLGGAGHQRPICTITALMVVGLPSLVQLSVAPTLLGHLERNWDLIGAGQICD